MATARIVGAGELWLAGALMVMGIALIIAGLPALAVPVAWIVRSRAGLTGGRAEPEVPERLVPPKTHRVTLPGRG